ncbi:hypothetical protein SEA_PRAIRIE_32 [Arthrobacter phage Prairie]|uniref:Minor tail protein n=1 Tax=Arthrobacter phage Prairie TaxID=2816463 RepID=A0A8A5LMM0_9CAUD|nr:hypothetical protein SEA_PRAIRIE_32 [Arthrobacter phage Prairie]
MPFTPTDPTKAEVRVTGQAPNQQLEFYIPRGAKGEPGGIALGAILGTTDLNDIKTSGVYRQVSATYATPAANYPEACAGTLTVLEVAAGTHLEQEFRPMWFSPTIRHSQLAYRRTFFNGIWQPWRVYSAIRVDQAAGRAVYVWDNVNNREQIIYGDTGLRDITTMSDPSTFNHARALYIRRVGSSVQISGQMGTNIAGSYFSFWNAIPVGFRSNPSAEGTALLIRSNTNLVRAYVTSNNLQIQAVHGGTLGAFAAGDVININLKYDTTDPWPTSLPGTGVGSVANA